MPRSANRQQPHIFPSQPGTYVLLVEVSTPLFLTVGRLGTFTFQPGCYAYIGSAHGPGGLKARINRHLRQEKKPHWHIDALTAAAPVKVVWYQASPERLECVWAQAAAALPGIEEPVAGFGASDCRCRTHLFYPPAHLIETLWQKLGEPAVYPVS